MHTYITSFIDILPAEHDRARSSWCESVLISLSILCTVVYTGQSQFLNSSHPSFPLDIHMFVFYIRCISIFALLIRLSVQFFHIPHICINIYLFFFFSEFSDWSNFLSLKKCENTLTAPDVISQPTLNVLETSAAGQDQITQSLLYDEMWTEARNWAQLPGYKMLARVLVFYPCDQHRPSPSSNKHDVLKSIHTYQPYERRQIAARQAYWKVCLDKPSCSLNKAPTLHLEDFTYCEYLELNLAHNSIPN